MSIARIENYHGEPSIMIDGVPYPPMTMTTEIKDADYLKKMGEAGIKIFYIIADMRWNRPGDPSFTPPERKWAWFITPNMAVDGVTDTLNDMQFLLDNVPDAKIILRLNVSPSRDWINSHPDEQLRFSDGKNHPLILTNASRYEKVDNMHSMCSEVWRREADAAIQAYFDEIQEHNNFKDHVIGFFLCAGGTSEWYYPIDIQLPDGAYGDFSEPFRKHYGRFLKAKYGTEENLRRAWGDDTATFEHPRIPTPEESIHVRRADHKILELCSVSYNMEKTKAENGYHQGVFLNANENRQVADFFDAFHEGTADTIIHFAKALKTRFPNLLVGAFYGAYGCSDYYFNGTVTATQKVLDCGYIDFLAAPGTYNNREPGGITTQREMQDSFRLRNQIYICEDDIRTHLTRPDFQKEASFVFSPEDTLTVMKRDFARNLCEDVQGWWFDMGGDWYNCQEIMTLLKRQQEIAQFAYSLDRKKKNQIALIYNANSIHYVSYRTNRNVLDHYRTSDLGRIGAPVDYYFLQDMACADMPDYRLYVMLNAYVMTDEERTVVRAKAQKNNATVLWLYGAGLIDPQASTPLSDIYMEKTVGMRIAQDNGIYTPYFRVDPQSHPMVADISPSGLYGYIDREIHSNIWIKQSELIPQYLCPRFTVEDDTAIVLGKYALDGRAALAMKELDGYTSIYCATPTLRCDMLTAIAKQAGCHIYTEDEDVLFANESFVTLHAGTDGDKRIKLKKPCTPFEVYEKKSYGENTDTICLFMRRGETKMWSLVGEC